MVITRGRKASEPLTPRKIISMGAHSSIVRLLQDYPADKRLTKDECMAILEIMEGGRPACVKNVRAV